MKHVRTVTKGVPCGAAMWQEVICVAAHAIAGIVEAKGGQSPIVQYIDDKCDLPEPNP